MWAPLQVVKTIGRGWGVRSRVRLPAGSFVCEYAEMMGFSHLGEVHIVISVMFTLQSRRDFIVIAARLTWDGGHLYHRYTGNILLDTDADTAGLEQDDSCASRSWFT